MLRRYDWRVVGLVLALTVALFLTAVMPFVGYSLDPSTKFGAFFASWTAGLALFMIVGVFVAIASAARPHEDSYDARARNLFRRATGKKVDYVVERLKQTLEHYSELTQSKIRLIDYVDDNGIKKYLVDESDYSVTKSYIDDVETSFVSRYELSELPSPPPGHDSKNCLIYLKINGETDVENLIFDTEVRRDYSVPIERNSSCKLEALAQMWVQADNEPNTHEPVLFTQLLTLDVENALRSRRPANLRLMIQGRKDQDFEIRYGSSIRVLEARDLRPGHIVYDLRILAPE